jgi:hypothetical protein
VAPASINAKANPALLNVFFNVLILRLIFNFYKDICFV